MENLELNVVSDLDTKDVEQNINSNNNISDETVERSLNYNNLSLEQQKYIDEFIHKIDIENTNQILQYGSSAQNKISKFSDTVLDEVKTKDAGVVGDLLSDLVVEIKDFDMEATTNKKSFFGIFNSAKKQLSKIVAKYNKVENNINKIEQMLEGHKIKMMKDITVFDTMYDKNLEYFKEISLYIIAGEKKVEELRTVTLPELQRIAEETKDQVDVQKVNDMSSMIDRFEKKLYDLKTTRVISLQMAPQIRLIQNNDSELINKIQSSLINTIPLWKNQIVIALGLTNAKNALSAQREVSNITNDMLKQNSELLKQGTIEIAQESEKAIVDVETLQKTNSDIIETLDKLLEIHSEGKKKRKEAEIELVKIESELKEKLLEVKHV